MSKPSKFIDYPSLYNAEYLLWVNISALWTSARCFVGRINYLLKIGHRLNRVSIINLKSTDIENGKEVLGLLLGVFGTIIGFYFASELGRSQRDLNVSPILLDRTEAAAGSTVKLTAAVQGGAPPYRYALVVGDEELPAEYSELARADGWVVQDARIPERSEPGVHKVTLGVRDAAGEKQSTHAFVKVT